MITPSRRILLESCPLYYPFGNTGVQYIFKDISFETVGDEIKVLFLGCGDIRNALQATSVNTKKLHIHLNDINPSVMARNVLILKIISADGFDIEKKKDISFLWDIWYNAEWPETTHKRFKLILQELLQNNLPENAAIPKSTNLQSLKAVWSAWSSISSKTKSEAEIFMKKINKERICFMLKRWKVDIEQETMLAFSKSVDLAAFHLESKIEDLDDSIRKKIHEEARMYYFNGNCRLQNGSIDVCVNPTMLNPTTHLWQVHYQLCPFDGYLPLAQGEELDMSNSNEILIRSCQKILQTIVTNYRRGMEMVKFVLHVEDALELCHSVANLSFDAIDCSNLADHVGLVNLINACEKRLAKTPEAVLFTETMTWTTFAPSALKYVEEALCCPLSMIPTIYGLRLANHIQLGSIEPVNFRRMTGTPVRLCWQKALPFGNLSLNPSPSLTFCLDQLAKKCFLVTNPRIGKDGEHFERCGMLCYTPLSFNYVVNSMTQRLGDSCFFENTEPSLFKLTRRTLQAWKNNEMVLKISSDFNINEMYSMLCFGYGFKTTPVLRLVLYPLKKFNYCSFQRLCQNGDGVRYSAFQNLSVPDVHFIDNFQLEMKHSPDGEIESCSISFLLSPDHGLENTHGAFVFDLVTGLVIFNLELMSTMQVEKFGQSYPHSKGPSLPLVTNGLQMRVKSCTEDQYQYILQIMIECDKTVSGLKVDASQCLPCESAHGINVSLSQPNHMNQLALSFPHPIIVNEISATLHRKDRLIDLVLKKALYEPWPCEFQTNQSKWVVDNFEPWKDSTEMSSLGIHLGTQFKCNVIRNPSLLEKSDLNQVRELIKSFFFSVTVGVSKLFSVQREDSTEDPDWYIKAHPPVRFSPNGSPILMLSVFDHRLGEKFASMGKLDAQKYAAHFFRILGKSNHFSAFRLSASEIQLFRYLLRLNSTKILPSIWQQKNLPLGENSPWLATFVSPLYDDCPMNDKTYPYCNFTLPSNQELITVVVPRVKKLPRTLNAVAGAELSSIAALNVNDRIGFSTKKSALKSRLSIVGFFVSFKLFFLPFVCKLMINLQLIFFFLILSICNVVQFFQRCIHPN